MDNYVCSVHPRIRQLLTGDFEPPLLSHDPYLDYMQSLKPDEPFIFNHATADQDIKLMRDTNLHGLADACERILDNPPAYDEFGYLNINFNITAMILILFKISIMKLFQICGSSAV